MPGTNCHENITRQTQSININVSLWYTKTTSFRKNEEILVPIWNPYPGSHSGYKTQIWIISLSLQHEPQCQISRFSENIGLKPLLFVPIWCGIYLLKCVISQELMRECRHRKKLTNVIIWEMHAFPDRFPTVWKHAIKPMVWVKSGKLILILFP